MKGVIVPNIYFKCLVLHAFTQFKFLMKSFVDKLESLPVLSGQPLDHASPSILAVITWSMFTHGSFSMHVIFIG